VSGWGEWLTGGRFAGMSESERAQLVRSLEETRDRVLDGARLVAGDDVLDLGAGTGALTFGAHARIGDGWVYAVDRDVESLEELLAAAHVLGAAGIVYLVGDADVLPLPDDSVDVVVARSALVPVADLGAAATELCRVLRPGGRVSLQEPLDRDGAYLATAIDWSPLGPDLARRVREEGQAYPASSPPARLDEDDLEAAFRGAGLADVRVELEPGEERWTIDRASADARLDVVGPGEPSLRRRWEQAFSHEEVERLTRHLAGLSGTTVTFRHTAAWVTAHRP